MQPKLKLISKRTRQALQTQGARHETARDILAKLPLYFLLLSIAFLYLEPIFYMLSMSFKSASDIIDPTTKWIPKEATLLNLRFAFKQMGVAPIFQKNTSLWDSLMTSNLFVSLLTTLPPALIQVFTCAVTGYAFGRLTFPFKRTLFVLLLLSYIVPPQTVFIPQLWVFNRLGIINSPLSFIVPALFAGGIKGSLFIIIYMEFFRKIPHELEEAACIDGASKYRIFWKVMYPLARPARVTVLLFSLVWHWNETYLTNVYYTRISTMATQIARVTLQVGDYTVNIMPLKMASALLFIAPILILYFFTQRLFTESIERTGIVE